MKKIFFTISIITLTLPSLCFAQVANYLLNDNDTNTTIVDNINSLNGTAQQNTNLLSTDGIDDIANTAISFNGTSDYIAIASSTHFNQDNLTVSMWINLDTVPTPDDGYGYFLFGKEDGSFDDPYLWIWLDDAAGYEKVKIDTYNCGISYIDTDGFDSYVDTWTNLVFVLEGDSGSTYIYKDGKLVAGYSGCSSLATDLTSNTKAVEIGRWADDGSFFDGKMQDIKVYDEALSSSEIKRLYFLYYPYYKAPIDSIILKTKTFVVGFVTDYWGFILSVIIILFIGNLYRNTPSKLV